MEVRALITATMVSLKYSLDSVSDRSRATRESVVWRDISLGLLFSGVWNQREGRAARERQRFQLRRLGIASEKSILRHGKWNGRRASRTSGRLERKMEDTPPPLPVYRQAERCLTECPRCRRTTQARWLRYAHRCGNSWDLGAREQHAVERARAAFLEREASSNSDFGREKCEQIVPQTLPQNQTAKRPTKDLSGILQALRSLG